MGKAMKVIGGLLVIGMIGAALGDRGAPLPEAPPRFLANRADSVALVPADGPRAPTGR